jgi:type VI secretion system protein ImpA
MNPTTLPDRHGLLAAVDAACPAGIDLRCDDNDLFQQTRDIRNSARDSERQRAHGNHDASSGNTHAHTQWQQVAELCCRIISTHSKDLDVCAWLIEAQTRLHGAQGLADGLMLYCELVQQYWDDIFPRPDAGEGIDTCVAAISGLNGNRRPGSVVEAINNLRITCCTANKSGDGDYALWHYRTAVDAQRITDDDKRLQRIVTLGYSLQDIQQAADRTATAFYATQHAAVESALMALHRLDAVLMQKLGSLAPATSMMRDTLGSMHDVIFQLAGRRIATDVTHDILPQQSDLAQADFSACFPTDSAACFPTGLHSRDDAIRCLDDIAQYFRNTEPHSPLAYSIDTLVRRARLPFDQLMRELIPDPSARDVFQLMTGVPLISNADTQR